MFTADGVLVGATSRYEGAAELATVPAKLGRYLRTMHVVANHVVDLDGDRATGETTCVAHHLHDEDATGERDRVLYLRYHDAFVRTGDGWRIAERRLEVSWVEDRPVTIR